MFRRPLTIIAIIGAVLAAWIYPWAATQSSVKDISPPREYIRGTKNNSVLFVVSEHAGLSNVHLATAQALLENHPDIEIHFASFPIFGPKVLRLSQLAKTRQPLAQNITFHALEKGRPFVTALLETIGGFTDVFDEDGLGYAISAPGLAGINHLMTLMQHSLAPWTAEEHLALFNEISHLITSISPATVVLDILFAPAIEATRSTNWLHAFITPNMVVDNFLGSQPHGKMLWKYPAVGSGFPYPVPWHLIPANIYLNFRLIYGVMTMKEISAKRNFLSENNVPDPINFYALHRDDTPWLTQTTENATIPVDVVPPNVTCTGPIVLSPVRVEDHDPELVVWMKQRRTVLINLGTAYVYSIAHTRAMIGAIQLVLEQSDVQVLWKYKPSPNIASKFDWEKEVEGLIATGRVKISQWFTVDPPALLQSGLISLFVSHGGANGYHESIEAGVPMVILPFWVDLFTYSQLVEQVGVGLWACRETSPHYHPQCLSKAILNLLGDAPEAKFAREKVKQLSNVARKRPGRDVAADAIAKLARL